MAKADTGRSHEARNVKPYPKYDLAANTQLSSVEAWMVATGWPLYKPRTEHSISSHVTGPLERARMMRMRRCERWKSMFMDRTGCGTLSIVLLIMRTKSEQG